MERSRPALLLCLAFAASGAAALAFETLWFHQAQLALGSGVWASSLVLAGFMAGLALGNVLATAVGTRLGHPVRAYAALELAIAASGVALVYALPSLAPWLAPRLGALAAQPALQNALRLASAFTALLVPATAMGLGLPLLTAALRAGERGFGPALGRLYGWNTLGAVAGALVTETWWIDALGVRGAAWSAGGLAALAAAAALTLAGHFPRPPPTAPVPRGADAARRGGWTWLAAAFLAGFALLALEVVWFRFLSLFVVTHAEAFAWMLATVLAGIALGGLAASRGLARRPDAHRFAAALALLAGALCVGGYAAAPAALAWHGASKVEGAAGILALAAPLTLPVASLSGALFALAGSGLRRERRSDLPTAGALAFANTCGAALGPLAAGFLLLPGLGMERSLFALAALYAGIGALLCATRGAARGAALACALPLGLALALFPFGAMERRHFRHALAAYRDSPASLVSVREGRGETILLVETRLLGEPYTWRLVTDSFSMSGTDVHSRRYMKLFAWWPLAVHPAPRAALLISYGVGSTAKALTDSRELERIDVVDTSREILETSARIHSRGGDPLRDPRVRVHVEDGRYFLRTTRRRYDLITAEPPPPMLAGVVHLYTREHFRLLHDRLADGGIATYWLPLRSLSDASALAVVRAFCDAFADCSLWNGMEFNLMLVGTRGAAGPVSREHFERLWRDPAVAPELRALGFERPAQLGALFAADAAALGALTRDVPALVDDRPRRIAAPPTSREAQARLFAGWLDPRARRAGFVESPLVERLWPPSLRREALRYFEMQHLLDTFGQGIRSDRWSERLRDLTWVLTRWDLRAPALWLLGSDADVQRILARADPVARAEPEMLLQRAYHHLADRDFAAALEPLRRAESHPTALDRALPLRIYALCLLGRRAEAQALATARGAALGDGELARDYWEWMGGRFGIAAPGSPWP